MKRAYLTLTIAVFLLICLNGLQAQARQTKPEDPIKDEQELIKLEKAWAEAVIRHDTIFLHNIWADNYAWTSSFGKVWAKTETLASIISGEDVVQEIEIDDIKVRLFENTGVVTGHTKFKETYRGTDVSGEERFTDTWVKRNGKWQCVAMHCSRIVVQ